MSSEYPYYSIVSFGRSYGPAPKAYYRSLDAAAKTARAMRAAGTTNVRVVGCKSLAAAKAADISDSSNPVIFSA